ncbi:MAG: KUP/HAK/KT family potassium transporter [Deltaproteobacteria bacterium]|nr:KUP/HAK/KT family potassium transporter [Deltaproteobacteria bacterium]MCX7952167.1 KUP/HAK/KT family potassium transporter [Deltaproteobacteria bacterium]
MDRSPSHSFYGFMIALGLVFGDIGTSPLYVLRAAVVGKPVTEPLVLGCLSLVFWTLTFLVSIKYITLVLKADNQGEGGILALYNLVKRRGRFVFYIALFGFSGLVAEAVITPAISVLAAVEGFTKLNPDIDTTSIAVLILIILFVVQNLGSVIIGKNFGLIMFVWFGTLFFFGLAQVLNYPSVIKAINPYYAISLVMSEPHILGILGAIFLCITGVEALYSDLGHAGRDNIRNAWIFVKIALITNYFGQGAYLLKTLEGDVLPEGYSVFYDLFPKDFLPLAIILSTISTVIASQAVISGMFSLVSSAITLNLLPKWYVKYPGDYKGQVFIPLVNLLLALGCLIVTVFFKNSWNLEHAYGLSVNITLICTSLLYFVLNQKVSNSKLIAVLFIIFLLAESVYLKANLLKLSDGAYFTLALAMIVFLVLFSWHYGYRLLRDLREFVEIKPYLPKILALSNDNTVPVFSDNLIYLTESAIPELIESRILYSIIRKRPKRALTYFFIHLEVTDKPYEEEMEITRFELGKIYRLNFRLGFKNRPNLQKRFMDVYQKLVDEGEIEDLSSVPSLKTFRVPRSVTVIALSKLPFIEKELSLVEKFVIGIWSYLRSKALPKWRSMDLDESLVVEEKVPAFAALPVQETIKRLI